jgi:DNA-binding NarL/FixJ family response regulator
MIKLAIADDHKMFCAGLRSIIETKNDIEVIKSVPNGALLLEYLENNEVDIILMDINMPEVNGIEASKIILEKYKSTRIIILSMLKKPLIIRELLKIGVHGYILKDTETKELLNAIYAVNEYKKYYDPRVKEVFLEYFSKSKYPETIKLTARETEILKLIYKGNTTQEIADKLFISPYTVETHRKNLMIKSGCKNALELAKYYTENELLI